jgi:hypothetical protein
MLFATGMQRRRQTALSNVSSTNLKIVLGGPFLDKNI